MADSFAFLSSLKRVILRFVSAGQVGRVRMYCNRPHIFVDRALKSQALRFTPGAHFAVKWNERPSQIAQFFLPLALISANPANFKSKNIFQLE